MKPYAIGIDIGGTKLAAGLVDRKGQILARYTTQAHAEQQPRLVIEAVEGAYQALLDLGQIRPDDIAGVGLGFPGNTNGQAGVVLVSSNLPAWNHFPLRRVVSERLGVTVVLDNDTNMAVVGEHRYGAGRGASNLCYVTLSTGYGIGIIINNELYTGHTGTAGELGHVVVEVGGPPCSCGKRGCIMAYASGIGMSRMVYERIVAGEKTLLRQLAPSDGRRIGGEVIAAAAAQGDSVAQEIVSKAGYYCGVGLSVIVQLLNPELIILGGGLTRIGAALLDPALAAMREHSQPELWDSVRVEPWQLGDDLGMLGGAARVFSQSSRGQQ